MSVVDLSEFSELLRILNNWTEYILNSFDCKYTNCFTEGCNNKIKVLKHIAFGYRNFNNLRQRASCSPQTRRDLRLAGRRSRESRNSFYMLNTNY